MTNEDSSSPCPDLPPVSPPLALSDIQGLILRGYSYRYIRHFIFTISSDPKAIADVQKFCGNLVPGSGSAFTVTTAEDWGDNPPPYCLNIGMTSSGLSKLIGAANYATVKNSSNQLFTAFDPGAAARAVYVGDTDTSAPANWWQNGGWQLPNSKPAATELDFLVSLYALSPADRDAFGGQLLKTIPNGSDGNPAAVPAFIMDCDPILDADGNPTPDIHFGYHDGISQPRIQGAPNDDIPDDDLPCVPPYYFVVSGAKAAPYNAHHFLYNGCFGAFRLLFQDVPAFEAFIGQSSDPDLLAAKMCGRWFDGTPLEVSPDGPDPTLTEVELSNFGYLGQTPHQKQPLPSPASDTTGARCPYAAHTRRSNPRDDTSVHFNNDYALIHRVRRFATAFGPTYAQDPGAYRGLIGLFMGADLVNQFEFLMGTWISQGNFRSPDSPNQSGVDPLFGPQAQPPPALGNTEFEYLGPDGTDYETVPGLTRFIRTDGGLYVFLPSIAALGNIANGTLPG